MGGHGARRLGGVFGVAFVVASRAVWGAPDLELAWEAPAPCPGHDAMPFAETPGAGAHLNLVVAEARGCVSFWRSGATSVGGCALGDFVYLRAAAFGIRRALVEGARWPALGVGLVGTHRLAQRFGFFTLAELTTSFYAPRFLLESETPSPAVFLHQPSSFAGRITAGTEFFLP
jgi:hypothetical protein